MERRATLVVIVLLGLSGVASAACPPSCPIPGGGPKDPATDCLSEFGVTGVKLNYPAFDPAKPTRPSRMVRCHDGEPGCDLDGEVNNSCLFDIDVCLRNPDPALASCVPSDVTALTVSNPKNDPDLAALQAAAGGLLPATTNVCTTGQTLAVALKGPNAKGAYRKATKKVRLEATAAGGSDVDLLKLFCLPHEWPSHGYNHANHRASAVETRLTPANASTLVPKWIFDPELYGMPNAGQVTSTPTVAGGLVYVTTWSGWIYALRARSGTIKWSYDTASGSPSGVQSSVTVTADGRALVGDSRGVVHCLNAKNGALLWTANVGDPVADSAHIWGSPVVANGRVFVGRASHSDVPCTQGHLYAFDLDTGAELWRHATVPARVCNTDTAISCTTDADCGGAPDSCVDGKGGGVTASVAVDASGETVFMSTVGCYTFPSIGNSESIFSLDAATGAANWVHRTQAPEQFADGPPYHDYGFLNGPLLIDGDDGLGGTRPLVVAGSKDGTIYALDPATGAAVWTRSMIPAPDFAGFGLFNAALGFADHKLFATLYQVVTPNSWPAGNDHLYAFHDLDGSTAWSRQIGASWGSIGIANGVVFAGTQASTSLYLSDAATGTPLVTLPMPANVAGGATVVDGVVYVPYWFGSAGVTAFALP